VAFVADGGTTLPPGLQALYQSDLAPWLERQDARVAAAKRNRWIVLVIGLAIAGGLLTWALRRNSDNELLPMAAFAVAVVSIGYFWLVTREIGDDIRHFLLGRLATFFGIAYEAAPKGFDLDRFALLGLAGASEAKIADRLHGDADGLAFDFAAARLTDKQTEMHVGRDDTTRTTERFSGLLMLLADPLPPGPAFRLVPHEGAARLEPLRGVSRVIRVEHKGGAAPGIVDMLKMAREAEFQPRPEEAPPIATGDAAFDRIFELHVLPADQAAALGRLSAPTRQALVEIAGLVSGVAVSAGFEKGAVLIAFATKRRFEIGPLRPPMADFARVEHLAGQIAIVFEIAGRLRRAATPAGAATG
jgi:hypothetical protein